MKLAIAALALLACGSPGSTKEGTGSGSNGRVSGFIPHGPFVPGNGTSSGGGGGGGSGTGTVTSVVAGTGLTGGTITSSGTIAVDPTAVQTRVSTTCGAGQFLTAIAQGGTATCTAEPGDISSVVAGTGLTGGATSGAATLNVDPTVVQTRVSTTCGAGQFLTAVAQDGTATCTAEPGDITAVTAGTGLTGGAASGAATLNVDTSVVQSRVTGTCSGGSYQQATASGGTITCSSPRTEIRVVDEFVNGITTPQLCTMGNSGTAAVNAVGGTAVAGHPGTITASTGSTSTGRATCISNVNMISFASAAGAWSFKTGVTLEALGSAADHMILQIGFIDASGSDQTDGAYFEYDSSVVTNQWRCVGATNNSRTKYSMDGSTTDDSGSATGAASVVANTWDALEIALDTNNTTATYFVNGTLKCTITAAHLPTGSARATGLGWRWVKNGGSTGTTAMVVDLDYVAVTETLSR